MSQQAFAAFIDMSAATLSSIFNGRTKPTLAIVEAIKTKIPNINTDWLMFGSGTMYKSSSEAPAASSSSTSSKTEPMLDFGFDEGSSTGKESKSEPQVKQEIKGVNNTPREIPKTEIKFVDKPQRHVVEIKVYYDDYTYESFYPASNK